MSANIRERVFARGDLDELRAARQIDKIAEALNSEGLREIGTRWVTARTIIEHCTDGEDILVALEHAADQGSVASRWILKFLATDPGVDVGREKTQEKITELFDKGALTQDQTNQLRELAMQDVIVDQVQVAQALYEANGTEK